MFRTSTHTQIELVAWLAAGLALATTAGVAFFFGWCLGAARHAPH